MNELNITDIKDLMKKGFVKWSQHLYVKMSMRNISPEDVEISVMCGEIIEQYPNDYPYPSCLILGRSIEGRHTHVVCGVGGDNAWLITAYHPDEYKDEWSDDFRVRKGV